MTNKSVCVITEDLSQPIDEGIKHFAHSLIESLPEDYEVLGLSVNSVGQITTPRTASLKTNRLLLNSTLWERIRDFQPHIICYLPSASATLFSFLRSRVLKLPYLSARVIMVSLQPRDYNWFSRRLIRFLSPDAVFVQNEDSMKRLLSLGCRSKLLPSGVDLKKFTPVSPERKTELRAKYGLDKKAFTVLHVGHLTKGRNVERLMQVKYEQKCQVILVSSSLHHKDGDGLKSILQENGIIVMDNYLPSIEEIYQLSDCYLFPVFSDRACIGVPLSVLEAMACNLPVVSVRYGSLPVMFEQGGGLTYADTPEELSRGITAARNFDTCRTREKVTGYSWPKIARFILDHAEPDTPEPADNRALKNTLMATARAIWSKFRMRPQSSLLVSFSGLDGSGKTQHARELQESLKARGLKMEYYWSRCGTFGLTQFFSRCAARLSGGKSDRQESKPGAEGRSSRLNNPFYSLVWTYLAAADIIIANFPHVRLPLLRGKVVVCDRYIYDAAAEIESSIPGINWLHRLAINLMLATGPKPDIAYFLDVPEDISNRRKETKTDIYYLSRLRAIYFRLSDRHGVLVKNNFGEFKDIAAEIAGEVSALYQKHYPTLANAPSFSNPGLFNHRPEEEKV